jgi:hypothetical protein
MFVTEIKALNDKLPGVKGISVGQPPALGRALKRRLAAAAAASPPAGRVHSILSTSTSIAVRLEPVHRPIWGKEARERPAR